MPHRLLSFIVAFFMLLHAKAQVSVTTDKRQIMPGEALQLSITIKASKPTTAAISDSNSSFEILHHNKPDTQQTGANFTTQQTFVLTAFDSGYFALPAITTPGFEIVKGDSIAVVPMPADSLKGYAHVKTFFADPPFSQKPVEWILLGAALVSGTVLWLLHRRYNKAGKQLRPAKLSSPEEWKQQIAQLQKDWNNGTILPKAAAGQLMLLMREMMNLKGINVQALTGEEMVQKATNLLPADEWKKTDNAVAICYAVLFAKHQPEKKAFNEAIASLSAIGHRLFTTTNASET